ncbi:molybdopterin-dependent oxidoreductase [Micromonospora sp. NPDC049900]|uniref:molybdopterin-dependent oxidoreductase n=1 Tax=Micromonospora sp. NPDC049900 TaxID=3364275 RepID=UPI0037966356
MSTQTGPRPVDRRSGPRPRPHRWHPRAVLVGVLAAAVALGVARLAAAFLGPASDPVLAVGATAVDTAPQPVKAWAIRTFGTADKLVLLTGVYTVLTAAAAAIGVAAFQRRRYGLLGLAAFTGIGVTAILTRPTATALDTLPTLGGAAVAAAAMLLLLRTATTSSPGTVGRPRLLNRRQFLATAAGTTATAAGAATAGTTLAARNAAGSRSRATVVLPAPIQPAARLPADTSAGVNGVAPFITANRDFYRVDTALAVPQVDVDRWRLTLDGAVDRPRTWRFDELLARGLMERDLTLNCVSNEVGGPYIGTARWSGVPLAPLLREAGIRPGQDQLVSRSVDGMTIGTPLVAILDGRDAMLAVAMNGEPLPLENGFPVRMLVPGLYGYVGACKWLTAMTVTTFDAFDTYWVERGWAHDAPVKTASRIDTPKPFARRPAGPVMIAGVAWAQRRGITAVQVQVDDGPWQAARLAAGPSPDLWRQWAYRWPATPGSHTIRVRASDSTGATQPERRRTPYPDGATGWHSISVTIT